MVGERQAEVEPGRGGPGCDRACGQAQGQLRVVDRVGRVCRAGRRRVRKEPAERVPRTRLPEHGERLRRI